MTPTDRCCQPCEIGDAAIRDPHPIQPATDAVGDQSTAVRFWRRLGKRYLLAAAVLVLVGCTTTVGGGTSNERGSGESAANAPAMTQTTPHVELTETSQPAGTIAATEEPTLSPTATPTKVAMLRVPEFEFRIIGAAKAPTFSDAMHLGELGDGRHWLVVTYEARNVTSEERGLDSDSIRLVADGEEIKEASAETEGAADELGARRMGNWVGTNLDAGTSKVFVHVFKVAPDAQEHELQFDFSGKWAVDLDPYLADSRGIARTLAPTPTPTATPTAVSSPSPTATTEPKPTPPEPTNTPGASPTATAQPPRSPVRGTA
jgi:hypothetical protein